MNDSHLGNSLFGRDDGDNPAGARPEGEEVPAERHRLPAERPPATRAAARRRAEARAEHDAEMAYVDERGGGDDDYDDRPARSRRPWIPLLLALALVVGGGFVAVRTLGVGMPSLGFGSSQAGGDYEGEGSGQVDVKVEQGDSGSAIGARLQEAGVVKSGSTFAQVFATNPDASKIQPGTYRLRKEMSSSSALTLMLTPGSRTGQAVTIPEGLWASEIYARLAKATNTPIGDYTEVDPKQLGLPPGANNRVEGYLFPSTYEFDPKTSATDQLKRMVAEFKRQVRPLGIRADNLNRVMTVASIVQGESRAGADGPKVARVVENRLKPGGETAGRLQMDSTVHYAIKKRGTVTTTAQQRETDSPYNTYRNQGLPPGPINNPGVAAIKAAAAPAEGNWLYFVTVNQETGETKFAETKPEHDKNVREFRTWCRDNPGKC